MKRHIAKYVCISLIWGGTAALWGAFFVYCLPMLEGRFFPVLEDQENVISEGDRTPGQLCWDWYWRKQRFALPIASSWALVVDSTNVEFPTFVRREKDASILTRPNVAELGAGKTSLCVAIPLEMDALPNLEIRGTMAYRLPHGGTLWQPIPRIKVPPLKAPS